MHSFRLKKTKHLQSNRVTLSDFTSMGAKIMKSDDFLILALVADNTHVTFFGTFTGERPI